MDRMGFSLYLKERIKVFLLTMVIYVLTMVQFISSWFKSSNDYSLVKTRKTITFLHSFSHILFCKCDLIIPRESSVPPQKQVKPQHGIL